MKKRLPSTFYNLTTMIGATVAAASLILIVFLFVLDHFSGQQNAYMGLITFVGLPPFLILGILLIIVGVLRASKRLKMGKGEAPLPKIDFNSAAHRKTFVVVVCLVLLFAGISAFGSYKAYEYTESVQFCGTVCHNVMEPEYTAYQNSPHAKVPCTGCHIGSGGTWYVRSKLSGVRQVFAVMRNSYHRPIETPIRNLRPAKETCEECHWPKNFYSQKLKDRTYFLSDEANSKYEISMLMKIGGSDHGRSAGIHAHMYLDQEVEYIASDRQRQVIPYVEVHTKDGKVEVFKSTENPPTEELMKKGERRTVDCIDCHNRPSHRYMPAEFTVNTAMANGWIDPGLPEIKMKAVELLDKPYKNRNEALSTIKSEIVKFYNESHADVAKSKAKQIEAAISQIQRIYGQNYFPEMKVSWRAYPNNLDHLHSAGCFRCHDDKHVSDKGKVISRNCQTCHTILSQAGPDGKRQTDINGLTFQHPGGDGWETDLCMTCHRKDEEAESTDKPKE